MKRLLKAWPLGAGLLLLAAFYWNVLTGEKALLYRDMSRFFLPLRQYLAERLRGGEFPMWYPYDGLGADYLGNVVQAALHPSALLHLLLPQAYALSLSAVLSHLAAGAGAYLLVHRWTASAVPSFIAALSYAFSGYLLCMDGNLAYLLAAAAIPWSLHCFEGYLRCQGTAEEVGASPGDPAAVQRPGSPWCRKGALPAVLPSLPAIPWILGTTVSMWCLATSGDIQAIYITSLLLLAMALAGGRRHLAGKLSCLAAAGMLTLLMASPQLLPAMAATGALGQGAEGLRFAFLWSLNPLQAMDFLVPGPTFLPDGKVPADLLTLRAFDSYWSDSLFIGAPVLALAGLALARPSQRWVRQMRFSAAAGLATFLLAMGSGQWNPAYALFQKLVPGWNFLRYPQKSLVFATLAVALLAGLGASRLLDGSGESADGRRKDWRAFMRRAAFWSAACLAACVLVPLPSVQRFLLVLSGGLGDAAASELSAIVPAYQDRLCAGMVFGLAAMALGIPARPRRDGAPSATARAALLLAAAAPLLLSTWGMHQTRLRSSPETVLQPHPLTGPLEDLAGANPLSISPSRPRLFAQNDADQARDVLASRGKSLGKDGHRRLQVLNLAYGMSGIFRVGQAVGSYPMTGQARQRFVAESIPDAAFWNGFSVDAAILPNPSPTGVEDAFIALPNPGAGARIRLVRGIPVHDMDEAAAVTKGAGFDATATIPVELPEGASWAAFAESFHGQSAEGTVKVDDYRPERVAISTDAPAPSTLFIADGFAPGWTATVDGHPADILPGLVAGRAVLLPAGRHRVEMNYRTPGLRAGFILAGIGWAILLAAFILWRRGTRQSPPPASRAADAPEAAA